MRRVLKLAAFVLGMPCLVDDAFGQTSTFGGGFIAGVVRDADGAVLPGVVVEASSPVLIEGVRSSVTDRTGRYTIRGLRPGSYTVTFTLQAYRTVKRERILIEGSAARTVDPEMVVGGADSVVVVAETPVVDIRNTSHQEVISDDLLDRLASGRNPHDLMMLVLAVESSSSTLAALAPLGPRLLRTAGGRRISASTSMASAPGRSLVRPSRILCRTPSSHRRLSSRRRLRAPRRRPAASPLILSRAMAPTRCAAPCSRRGRAGGCRGGI